MTGREPLRIGIVGLGSRGCYFADLISRMPTVARVVALCDAYRPRAEAVRYVGANYLATPCAICKAQLPEVMSHFKVEVDGEVVRVGGVHDLLGRALIL